MGKHRELQIRDPRGVYRLTVSLTDVGMLRLKISDPAGSATRVDLDAVAMSTLRDFIVDARKLLALKTR